MTDKELIKSRFTASYGTYNDNAEAQKIVVNKISEFLEKKYGRVLEIGCGTGLLTQKIAKLDIKEIYLNDLCIESEKYVMPFVSGKNGNFVQGDAEFITFPDNLDLIVSASAFQWFEHMEKFLIKSQKSLKKGGKLVFSTYTKGNYEEIHKVFGTTLDYCSKEYLKETASKYFSVKTCESGEIVLYFDTLKELLKHIKLTGTNAIKAVKLTKTSLKQAEEKYETLRTAKGLPLTYAPSYFVLEKI